MNYIGAKNILLILLAAVIIGGALVFSQYRTSHYSQKLGIPSSSVSVFAVATTTSTLTPISYNDNWEKTLSNAAGTSSSFWLSSGGNEVPPSDANAPLTKTGLFGRDLFAQYVNAKENGYDTSATNTQQAIADQVMKDGTVVAKPKAYTTADFKVSQDNSKAAIIAYGNRLAVIYKTDTPVNQPNELTIVQNALDANDPSILKQLDPSVNADQRIIKDLLAMTVPSGLANLDLAVINAMSELSFSVQEMQETFSDGITSLQGLALYRQAVTDLGEALNNVARYFVTVGITFQPNDPGSLFNIK